LLRTGESFCKYFECAADHFKFLEMFFPFLEFFFFLSRIDKGEAQCGDTLEIRQITNGKRKIKTPVNSRRKTGPLKSFSVGFPGKNLSRLFNYDHPVSPPRAKLKP